MTIEIMKEMREEVEKANFRINGERVKTHLEMSLPKCLKEVRDDETKIKSFSGKLQISFFAEVDLEDSRQAANTHASADFDDILFETVVKSV